MSDAFDREEERRDLTAGLEHEERWAKVILSSHTRENQAIDFLCDALLEALQLNSLDDPIVGDTAAIHLCAQLAYRTLNWAGVDLMFDEDGEFLGVVT